MKVGHRESAICMLYYTICKYIINYDIILDETIKIMTLLMFGYFQILNLSSVILSVNIGGKRSRTSRKISECRGRSCQHFLGRNLIKLMKVEQGVPEENKK